MTPTECRAESLRLLDEAARITAEAGAIGSDQLGPVTIAQGQEAARMLATAEGIEARAQVYATLALSGDPLEATLSRMAAESAEPASATPPLTIVPGVRVIWVQERPGRPGLRILATDNVGTVITTPDDPEERHHAQPETETRATAWVRWDDNLVSEHVREELAEVRGA